jgi:hypothetical protein
MPTIWDIEQLRPLEAIGKNSEVSFTLRGGVAFRFALKLNSVGDIDKSPIDLFDLTPFTADVDLVHSGPPEKTAQLLDAILANVPGAECFRWELQSALEDQRFQDGLSRGNFVPARLLRVSDDPVVGLIDPVNGLADIKRGQFRYHRNPMFRVSPLAQAGQDLGVFSALLYLQTLFEGSLTTPEEFQPGWKDAAAVFEDAASDREMLRQLEEHAYLRCRLRYLLVNAVAAHPSRSEFKHISDKIGLREFVSAVAGPNRPIQMDPTFLNFLITDQVSSFVLVSSARLSGDTLRLQLTTDDWPPEHSLHAATPGVPQMGPDQEILVVSPELPVEPGMSVSSRAASAGTQEFIYFDLCPDDPSHELPLIKDEDLSAFLMVSKSEEGGWVPFALPSVVERRRPVGVKTAIRINCLGLLETLTPIRVRIGLVAWKAAEL